MRLHSIALRCGPTFALCGSVVAANLVAWAAAFAALHGHPALLGTALLAYGLGLRHAVDADHIAAIDNVTRKLMQEGRRPIGVGSFFALGHSSIVLVAATAIAASATTLQQRFPIVAAAGGLIGTATSAAFLLAIALVNAVVLVGIYRLYRSVKRRDVRPADELAALLARRGLLTRLLRGLFGMVSRSWHMYPLGILFGLGFDTASEVGLLGIAASQAANGVRFWSILIFPALFAVGMSLIDTADGLLMLGAYGWAFADPIRKLHYNLAITGMSVAVASLVGGFEALGLFADRFGVELPGIVNISNLATFGCLIIAAFAASWALSVLVYRLMGYGKIGA